MQTLSETKARFPIDWPNSNEIIDLIVHDLPHASSEIEWWYFNTHLHGKDNRRLAIFCSFFRGFIGYDKKTKTPKYGHILTWAISDMNQKKYISKSRFEDPIRLFVLNRLRKGEVYEDVLIRRAVEEMMNRGQVPIPDRPFESPVSCSTEKLECIFGQSSLKKENDGSYLVNLVDDKIACELRFQPQKKPARHGQNGVSKGLQGEEMFYYFIPRNKVSGTIFLDKENIEVNGNGWYDHEFGKHCGQDTKEHETNIKNAWNWCAIQLDDNSEITVFIIKDIKTGKEDAMAVLINSDGVTTHSSKVNFESKKLWRSIRTFEEYPVMWNLEIPEMNVKLVLNTDLEDQEFITSLSKPAFWEGELDVRGTINGRNVQGLAYVERNGFGITDNVDNFFAAVSAEVRKLIDDMLPLRPKSKQIISLFAHEKRVHLLEGVDIEQLSDNLIKPVREITDRGGKAWRSYAIMACCEAVLGDSRKFYQWLAIPEFIHSGALIIDDLEDKSEKRRGGPTAHKIYGENVAINAGTNAYFEPHIVIRSTNISDSDKLKLYDLYFEALREAHVGQTLDIIGFNDLANDAVKTGNTTKLENRILAMYRLKTSAPVACLARMGAIAGGGKETEVEALGNYFERIGTAFQIVDDVLNLRGFEGDLKNIGEDLSAGKITLPVAKALGKLELEKRSELLKLIHLKSVDAKIIDNAIKIIEETNVLDECIKDAYELVESAWKQLDQNIEPTMAKIMLRVLGWYILERHY